MIHTLSDVFKSTKVIVLAITTISIGYTPFIFTAAENVVLVYV